LRIDDSNEDDTPEMCLTVVAVAAMSVVGRGSATAMVEEAVTAAAEEADHGPEIAPQNSETWIHESTGKQSLTVHLTSIYNPQI
jgi:hypothetical protein